jgi:hypothetical protein
MEGGLQRPSIALLAGQSNAQRARHVTGSGKQADRSKINPRTVPRTGGNLGSGQLKLRSSKSCRRSRMNVHKNARLTPCGRVPLVDRIGSRVPGHHGGPPYSGRQHGAG